MPELSSRLTAALSDRYRVERPLGRGGMAMVFLAEDLRHHRRVAVKVLDPELAASIGPERFLREIETVAGLTHPHILPLHDSGVADGLVFYVMPYVEGESLRDRLVREGPLPIDDALRIAREVADALSCAHGRGVVHRDVKPENILLEEGHAVLADFGIARASTVAQGKRLTTSGVMLGTSAYMSPEQAAGSRDVDGRSDLYSLACVLYEMLAGVPPFAGATAASLAHQHLNVAPRPVTELRPSVPPGVAAGLQRALAKAAADRFATVEQFAASLAPAHEGTGHGSRRESGTAPGMAAGLERPGRSGRPTARPRSDGHPPSLAVLYFENLSNEPDSDYFCAGITEDLLTDLSKVPGLKVASRNAVAPFRGRSVDIPRVAEQLGVEAVLEGSVRRSGGRLRINAQLICAADGFHLWAERYDRAMDDVFAVQEDIARSIAAALQVTLTPEASSELMKARPAGAEAYDLYLKGRAPYMRFTREDNRRALECFEQALAIEPDYVLAWAGVADCCAQMHLKLWDLDRSWLDRGRAAGERAVELGPTLPEAHKALALVSYTRGDPERAAAHALQAFRCNPRFHDPLDTLGWTLLLTGDLAGAERCFRRAIAIDPYRAYDHGALAHVLLYTGRYRECVDQLQRWQRLGPGTYYQTSGYAERAWALVYLGDLGAAEAEIREARALGLAGTYLAAGETLVAAAGGRRDTARALIEGFDLTDLDSYHAPMLMAEAAAFLGDAGAAARVLRTFEGIQTCNQKYWLYRIAPGLGRICTAPELREWLGERGRRIVWPREAPALAGEARAQLTDYREATGLPVGDQVP